MASLAAPNALAQQAEASAGADEEIVVTAQKREERLQDVPISIAVLGGEQLDQQSTGGALEALTSVPSISQATSDAGGMTQVSIRGVAPTVPFGGGSSTVGYYLDSIPFGLVNSAAVPNANAYDMSRMEVLRGPQGTLYGASALNGVVRIITNDADPTQFEVKARAGLSSTDGGESSYRADVALNMPIIEDRLALRVVAGRESLGGWIDQPARGVDDANNSTSDNLRLKLAFLPTDDLRIDLGVWYSREEYDAAPYADDDGNQSTPLAQPGETEFTAYNARVTYDLPFMSISSSTSFLDFNQFAYTDASYLAPIDPALLQLYSDLPAEVFTQELLLSSVGEGPWRWSAGFFYRDAQGERYQTLPAALPGPISWRDTSESTAIFGEVTRVFADGEFELTGGLRYFEDTSETVTLLVPGTFLPPNTASSEFDALTPRLVATWLPSPDFTMYASYSEGFRSGLNQTPLTLLQAPLPPAEADRLHNYEIGARGSLFNSFATYDAAVYYINWQDIQLAGSLTYGDPPVYISATINGRISERFRDGSQLDASSSGRFRSRRRFQLQRPDTRCRCVSDGRLSLQQRRSAEFFTGNHCERFPQLRLCAVECV
ncbi:MAG: TonB-dependent receptor [Hyphomonadaceae bacterium JAD_PAG50586_4]|nr:MAG: TonB-dependent receptor [Hyphomonadaceae bacterium JAD_PAG50586_4]